MAGSEAKIVSVLFERERELALIDAAIERALRGQGGTIAIEGVAGIGKSALLAETQERAKRAGLKMLSAAGKELERDFPFGAARQLFEAPLRNSSDAVREKLLEGAAAPARTLLAGVPVEPAPPDAAFALVHALYWLTANSADRAPMLMTVDDLQWADDDSLKALAYLVARVQEHPVLLAVAMRTGESGAGRLDTLLAGGVVEVLRPAPLSLEATAGAVRATVTSEASDALCAACHTATGGNPFLVRELARAAVAAGMSLAGPDASRLAQLAPETVSRATLPDIRRLGPAARALSQAVAVLDRAELRHAAALAELDETEAAEAADALTGAAVMAPGLPLSLAHPILRQVVLDDLSATTRELAHRRAARLLAQTGAEAETVASHLARCEPRGEAWAQDALRSAGRQALARGAPEAGVRALRRALAEGAGSEEAALLHELGQAEAACGDPAAAERLAAAHELADEPHARASILATLAEMRFVAGELDAAVDAFRRALGELDDHQGDPLELQLFLGYTMLARAYARSANDAHDRIRNRPRPAAAGDGLADLARRAALAYDAFLRGSAADEVRSNASIALTDLRLLAAGGPAAQAFYLTTWALAGSDGFEQAEASLDGAFHGAARSGSLLAVGLVCHHRLWSRWRRGQILQALADAEIALEIATRGWDLMRPAAAWARAECLLETGDVAGAAAALEDAATLNTGLAGSCVEVWPLMGRSRFELEHGDPAVALEAALRCGSLLAALHAENPAVADWRSRAALAAAALGDEARARELWQEELRLARAFGAPRAIGIALRAGGVIEGGESGIALLREADNVLAASSAVLERGRALTDLGAALRRARQPREARAPLRLGADLARECGAAALAVRARDELLAAGARPRREVTRGLAALTSRELRVAELAAQGHGNRDIAQALFITRKTVEAHMRSIFRKLDIGGREELPDHLARGGHEGSTATSAPAHERNSGWRG